MMKLIWHIFGRGSGKANLSAVQAVLLLPIALIVCLSCFVSHSKNMTSLPIGSTSSDGRYLMLVNTAFAPWVTNEQIAQFDKSAYDGLAVSFSYNYDTSRPPSAAEIGAKLAEWKRLTKKDLWPWVFLNRMVGANDAEKNPHTAVPYFHRFKGADLEGRAGARQDFLDNWKHALRAAKDARIPGIVCDVEFYNNYSGYTVPTLAAQAGKSPDEVIALLRQLGADMADAADAEYPTAQLWFLFTGLSSPAYRVVDNRPYFISSAYIVLGLLDEIQKRSFHLKVISGGEFDLGYCHRDLRELQHLIATRAESNQQVLQKYAGILELGGTMTVWSDRTAKSGFIAEGDCATATAASVEELQPYLELLLKTYRNVWIYGSSNGGYNAFKPESAPRFDAMIARARAATASKSPPATN